MMDEKKIIPYKAQKGNRPNIEKIIDNCIYGEIQENAKDFILWLKDKGITFQKHNTSTRNHFALYKKQRLLFLRFWDERIDFNHVDNHNQGDPQYWVIERPLLNKYMELIDNDEMTLIPWDFNKCGQCKPGKTCVGIVNGKVTGVKKVFLGKEYDGLCRLAGLRIKNPDNSAIESIKKLILLSMREINDKCGN